MPVSRRGILGGMLALVAAPAIVKASGLMQVRGVPLYPRVSMRLMSNYDIGTDQVIDRLDVLYGEMQVRPEWTSHGGVIFKDMTREEFNEIYKLDPVAEKVLGPKIDELTQRVADSILTRNDSSMIADAQRRFADCAKISQKELEEQTGINEFMGGQQWEVNKFAFDSEGQLVNPHLLPKYQYVKSSRTLVPAVSASVAVPLVAAAVIAKNPVVSRRFWGK